MERTGCVIAGGGPAGIMLGLLLARAGVQVTVLEKHGDFLRDFRGDTVHPTTLDLLDELGLGDEFAKLPARVLNQVQLPVRNGLQTLVSLRNLPGKHKYIAMVPQWDLLNLLARAAQREPNFRLRMNTEAVGLILGEGAVRGCVYRTSEGERGEIHAELTVACDGRNSVLRAEANLPVREWSTPMDAWWFRLPRTEIDPAGAIPVATARRVAVLLDRGDYWQCASIIAKGSDAVARQGPVAEVVRPLAEAVPWLRDRVDVLTEWDQVQLLNVRLDRLRRWYSEGFLCLGDAAHAMSPVAGVGINLAIQDAVAAARTLAPPLLSGRVRLRDLARVQRRRTFPTAVTQGIQRLVHARVIGPALSGRLDIANADRAPLTVRVFARIPYVRGIPPYLIARGIRPEHAPGFARRI
ncbi:FAD-dependent oxidoreductase [Nocardia callitridis]|uniref:FAD-dependent oxidoreductase n=1 Tax=Nocardia callitridis TaxID=648753 RepID=A0ABP9K9B9_9NOCA